MTQPESIQPLKGPEDTNAVPKANPNPFTQLIKAAPLSDEVKGALLDGLITKVEISSKESLWRIYIDLKQIVKRKELDILAQEMQRAVPELGQVQFFVVYPKFQSGLDELLNTIWDDIMYQLECKFPLIKGIIIDVIRRVEGDILYLDLINPLVKDFFVRKGCSNIIKEAIKEYGFNIDVIANSIEDEVGGQEWQEEMEKFFVQKLADTVKLEAQKPTNPSTNPEKKTSEVLR
jgi:DNA polymerase III alpha subunit (gram-positive type)